MTKKIPVLELPEACRKPHKGIPPSFAMKIDHWEVQGQSWAGRVTMRDGKRVSCGHKHKSEQTCQKCLDEMKRKKPGNCQRYRVEHIQGFVVGYKSTQDSDT